MLNGLIDDPFVFGFSSGIMSLSYLDLNLNSISESFSSISNITSCPKFSFMCVVILCPRIMDGIYACKIPDP